MAFEQRQRIISSKVDIVDSKVVSVGTQTDSVGTLTTSVGTQATGIDTKVTSVGTQATAIDSLTTSVGVAVDAISSDITDVDSLVTSVGTQTASVGTLVESVGTQAGSIGTQVTSVGTLTTSVGTQATAIDSKAVSLGNSVDSVGTATTSVGTQVTSVGTQATAIDSKVTSVGVQVTSTATSQALSTVAAMVGAIANNVEARVLAPEDIIRPDSGTDTVRVWLYVYDADGLMKDPAESKAWVSILNPDDSTYAVARTDMTRSATGRYYYDWSIEDDQTQGEYLINCDYKLTTTPTEISDPDNRLSDYDDVTGVGVDDCDASGIVYFTIIEDGGSTYHLNAYKDAAKTELIGHTASYDSTGAKAITEDNSSGLGGTITVDSLGASTTITARYFNSVNQGRYSTVWITSPDVSSKVTSVGTQVESVATLVNSVGTQTTAVDSKVTSVGTQAGSIGTQVTSVGTLTTSVGTQATAIDSKVTSVGLSVDSVGIVAMSITLPITDAVSSVGDQVTSVGLKVDALPIDIGSVGMQVGSTASDIQTDVASVGTLVTSVGTQATTIDSKVTSVGTQTGSVGTQVTSVGTQATDIDSKVTSVGTALADVKGTDTIEFTRYFTTNTDTTNKSLQDGGNDDLVTTAQTTSSTDWAILFSKVITTAYTGTKSVNDCELDLGMALACTDGGAGSGNGDVKLATVAGGTPTLTGAVDVPGTSMAVDTLTEFSAWRTGQYKGTQMNTLPYTVMVVGKVDTGTDVLSVKMKMGSTVSCNVTYS